MPGHSTSVTSSVGGQNLINNHLYAEREATAESLTSRRMDVERLVDVVSQCRSVCQSDGDPLADGPGALLPADQTVQSSLDVAGEAPEPCRNVSGMVSDGFRASNSREIIQSVQNSPFGQAGNHLPQQFGKLFILVDELGFLRLAGDVQHAEDQDKYEGNQSHDEWAHSRLTSHSATASRIIIIR